MHFAGAGIGEARIYAGGYQRAHEGFGTVHWNLLRKKQFFFEKKNQKTFANCIQYPVQKGPRQVPSATDKSFLVLFFKKELLSFN
jgi:hypothetical protein